VVVDEASLQLFLEDQVIPALQHLDLPYVRWAYEAGLCRDLQALEELAREISAFKLSREARSASLQMGEGRLQAALKISPHHGLESLAASSLPKHLIVVYGWQMAVARVPLPPALAGYFYQALAGACSASLKLIRIGQVGVQRVLQRTLADADSIINASMHVLREDAGWFSPMSEIAAMRHERANERLFIS
jgi:urease accessory protein